MEIWADVSAASLLTHTYTHSLRPSHFGPFYTLAFVAKWKRWINDEDKVWRVEWKEDAKRCRCQRVVLCKAISGGTSVKNSQLILRLGLVGPFKLYTCLWKITRQSLTERERERDEMRVEKVVSFFLSSSRSFREESYFQMYFCEYNPNVTCECFVSCVHFAFLSLSLSLCSRKEEELRFTLWLIHFVSL